MNRRGFGLAETLLAGMALSMVAASFLAINSALNVNTKVSYQQGVAAQLAQKALADLHYVVESNWRRSRLASEVDPIDWDDNLPNNGAACAGSPYSVNGVNYGCTYNLENVSQGPSVIQDGVKKTLTNDLARRVRVDITWPDGSFARTYSLRTIITNWRPGLL